MLIRLLGSYIIVPLFFHVRQDVLTGNFEAELTPSALVIIMSVGYQGIDASKAGAEAGRQASEANAEG